MNTLLSGGSISSVLADEESGYIEINRVSTNAQKKRFQVCMFPAIFMYKGEDGEMREGYFLNENRQKAPFMIGDGGTIRIYKKGEVNLHNIDALTKLIKSGRFPPGFELKIVDYNNVAKEKTANRAKVLSVQLRIQELESDRDLIVSIARRLGIGRGLSEFTFAQVFDYVQEKAFSSPALVEGILNDQHRDDYFVLDLAKENGLIVKQDGYYLFAGMQLGKTDEDLLYSLRQNPDMLSELRRRSTKAAAGPGAGNVMRPVRRVDEGEVDFTGVGVVQPALAAAANSVDFGFGSTQATPAMTPVAMSKFIKECRATEFGTASDGGQPQTLITYVQGRGYSFGTISLGRNEAEACQMLIENPGMYKQIAEVLATKNEGVTEAVHAEAE